MWQSPSASDQQEIPRTGRQVRRGGRAGREADCIEPGARNASGAWSVVAIPGVNRGEVEMVVDDPVDGEFATDRGQR